MKKLYSYFTSLSFILLINAGAAHGMELDQPTEVVSLKNQCLNYIGCNAQKLNLIDKLLELPAELAEETIVRANRNYINQNKNKLIRLAQSNNLDLSVSCAIARKLHNSELAYSLAQQGAITQKTAKLIINNFIKKTDPITCLGDFAATCNKKFSNEILGHGNYGRLYQELIHIMTDEIYEFQCASNKASLFSIKDFEQNFSITEIARFLNNRFDSKALDNGLITLSPCKRFFACTGYDQTIHVYNLKTEHSIEIDFFFDEEDPVFPDKVVFNTDCSQLGILCKDGSIYTITVPIPLLNNELSLPDLAALAYCKELLLKYISFETDDKEISIAQILFDNNQEACALDTFIAKNNIIQSFFTNFSSEQLITFGHTLNWSFVFHVLAERLSITAIEAAHKIMNNDNQFHEYFLNHMIGNNDHLFQATLGNLEAIGFLQDTIIPILRKDQANK